MWSVFFLVPVGRGQKADLLTGEEFEQVFAKLYELSKEVTFQIKTTEGMHYRRYVLAAASWPSWNGTRATEWGADSGQVQDPAMGDSPGE